MNITKNQILTYAAILIAGIILGGLFFGGTPNPDLHAGHDHESTTENGVEVWTCSMHPSVQEDEPGTCPICGMDLIPASSEVREDNYSMVMTEASMRLADIRTTPAVKERPVREIDLPGRVEVDERRISYVTTHFAGRIRDVKIDFTGAPIRKGEVMATVYSPELVSAQRELLQAVHVRHRNPQLYDAAIRKFRLWEFSDDQIQNIIDRGEVQTNMEILSPVDGFVMKRSVVDEQHVMEGSVIYEVANLDQLWVILEVYEEDLPWISKGDEITFQTRSNPGEKYQASIDFIDPAFDPQKRTIRLRADVENRTHTLRPDMLVRGIVEAEMNDEKILVPASAVLWTGPRSLVYVKDHTSETPRFEVREVELGVRAGDHFVIENGLNEGDQVVFNGNFRIDSEFQLADRFSMMNREPGGGTVPVHDHGKMNGSEQDHVDYIEELPHDQIKEVDGVTEDFREDFSVLIQNYLAGKEALFASDTEAVRQSFQQAQKELESIGQHRMQGNAHERWIQQFETIRNQLNQIINADTINEQRDGFRGLSDVMVEVINTYAVPGVIYHQYCPMEDASWLSREEQIQNPYSPDSMPGCGEVIERIGD